MLLDLVFWRPLVAWADKFKMEQSSGAYAPSSVLPEEHFLQYLETHFGSEEAQAQLETAINWGRYAEFFTFQENRGVLRLDEESEPVRPA